MPDHAPDPHKPDVHNGPDVHDEPDVRHGPDAHDGPDVRHEPDVRAPGAGPGRGAAIAAFHAGLAARPGAPTWHRAGWGSRPLQRARFDALVRAAAYRGGSVLDWGCGPADLFFHLARLDLPVRYTGIDIDPSMVDLARSRGVPNVGTVSLDHRPEGTFDYVFASGICQFRDPADPTYHVTIMETGYDISRRAFAANFLSTRRRPPDTAPDELYVDPATMTHIASAITDRWTLDHSYHPAAADFTIALHH